MDRDQLTPTETQLLEAVRRWQETHDRSNSEAVASLMLVARHVLSSKLQSEPAGRELPGRRINGGLGQRGRSRCNLSQ
jgi:hypothetical protein